MWHHSTTLSRLIWLCKWRSHSPYVTTAKLDAYRSCGSGCVFILTHDIAWCGHVMPRDKIKTYLLPTDTRLGKWAHFNLSHHCAKFEARRFCGIRYDVFILSRNITWSHDQRDMWLGTWRPFTPKSQQYYNAKFEAYRSCRSADITLLCHQHHVTTWSKEHVIW